MANIITDIQLSGITYQIQGDVTVDAALDSGSTNPVENKAIYNKFDEVEQVTAAALNELNEAVSGLNESVSGKQDTLIAGDYITIDTANTISTSGLVTVADNEVEPYETVIGTFTDEANLSWGSTAKTYAEGADSFETTYGGDSFDNTTNITIKNESGETVRGVWGWPAAECGGHICSAEPRIYDAVSGYVTVDEYEYDQETGGARIKFGVADGWKIVRVYNYNLSGYDKGITLTMYNAIYKGGQSARVIENTVFPELKELSQALSGKQDTLISGTNIKTINNESLLGSGNIDIQGGGSSYTAGDGIDITNDVISVTGKVDTSTYNIYTAATDTALASKADTATTYTKTEVDTALGGKADTSAVTEVSDALTAHTADTTVHTTAAEKTSWNGAVTNASNAITALGGLSLVKLTQAQYDALVTKDNNTLYVIVD